MRSPFVLVVDFGKSDLKFKVDVDFHRAFYDLYQDSYQITFLRQLLLKMIEHKNIQNFKYAHFNQEMILALEIELNKLFSAYVDSNERFGLHIYKAWEYLRSGRFEE